MSTGSESGEAPTRRLGASRRRSPSPDTIGVVPPRDPKTAARKAAAQAAEAAQSMPGAAAATTKRPRRGLDPITGELRRRDVLPLLVLHYISQGPAYGNQLMERIAALTEGVLQVNPNTM